MKKICITVTVLLTMLLMSCQKEKKTIVEMKTSYGDIILELNNKKAPVTVKNFVKYAKAGHYDGTIFHRVIDNFMIQGGGFTPDMKQKETMAPIKNEANNGLKNETGTIAMARTSEKDSATSQFFINVKNNFNLNNGFQNQFGYCVFGKVIQGMDVVDQIKAVETENRGPYQNVPVDDVIIKSVKVKKVETE